MKLIPTENYCLVRCLKDADTTAGGIIVPDVAKGKERPRRGRLVAVGPGPKRGTNGIRTQMELAGKEGVTVLYDEFSVEQHADDLRIDDCKHVLVNEDGILGVLDGCVLEPIHDRVVVSPSIVDSVTPSGLVLIPDVAKDKPTWGYVESCGIGKRDDDNRLVVGDLAPGDCVLFSEHAGTKIDVGGVRLLVMREEEIFAVDEDDPPF